MKAVAHVNRKLACRRPPRPWGPVGGGTRDQEESPAFIMNKPAETLTSATGADLDVFLDEVVG